MFLIAIACYFTASQPLAFAIGAVGLALEGAGLMQLIKSRKTHQGD
ncbi:MAG: hypothetical protein AB8B93_00090 [Pseudomonadales bacterium]